MSPGSAVDVLGVHFSLYWPAHSLVSSCFRCQDSILNAPDCHFLNFKSE